MAGPKIVIPGKEISSQISVMAQIITVKKEKRSALCATLS